MFILSGTLIPLLWPIVYKRRTGLWEGLLKVQYRLLLKLVSQLLVTAIFIHCSFFSQIFLNLVTRPTPGRIDQNSTVLHQ